MMMRSTPRPPLILSSRGYYYPRCCLLGGSNPSNHHHHHHIIIAAAAPASPLCSFSHRDTQRYSSWGYRSTPRAFYSCCFSTLSSSSSSSDNDNHSNNDEVEEEEYNQTKKKEKKKKNRRFRDNDHSYLSLDYVGLLQKDEEIIEEDGYRYLPDETRESVEAIIAKRSEAEWRSMTHQILSPLKLNTTKTTATTATATTITTVDTEDPDPTAAINEDESSVMTHPKEENDVKLYMKGMELDIIDLNNIMDLSSEYAVEMQMRNIGHVIRWWVRQDTPEGIRTAWQLWHPLRILQQYVFQQYHERLIEQQELDEIQETQDMDAVSPMKNNNKKKKPHAPHPRALFAALAILHGWRGVWFHHCRQCILHDNFNDPSHYNDDNDNDYDNDSYLQYVHKPVPGVDVDTPQQVFAFLQSILDHKADNPSHHNNDNNLLDNRCFIIVMSAVLQLQLLHQKQKPQYKNNKSNKNQNPNQSHALEVAPQFCELILHYMLDKATASTSIATAFTQIQPTAAAAAYPSRSRSQYNLAPDARAWTAVIRSWALCATTNDNAIMRAPIRALEIWNLWHSFLRLRSRSEGLDVVQVPQGQQQHQQPGYNVPDLVSYATLLQLLTSRRQAILVDRAAEIVLQMMIRLQQHAHEHEHEQLSLLEQYQNQQDALAQRTQRYLPPLPLPLPIPSRMPTLKPNLNLFYGIIIGYRQVGDAAQCYHWLRIMLDQGLAHPNVFSAVIMAAVETGLYDIAEQAYRCLQEEVAQTPSLYDLGGWSTDEIVNTVHLMRAMLRLYSKTQRPALAQAMLHQIEDYAGPDISLYPKASHYQDVLISWFNTMDEDDFDGDHNNPNPNHDLFLGRRNAAEQCTRVMLSMIHVAQQREIAAAAKQQSHTQSQPPYDHDDDDDTHAYQPTTFEYPNSVFTNRVLKMWLKTVDVMIRNERTDKHLIRRKRVKQHINNTNTDDSNTDDSNTSTTHQKQPWECADSLFRYLRSLAPKVVMEDTQQYTTVMKTWYEALMQGCIKDDSAATHILQLLREMEDESDARLWPDIKNYTMAVQAIRDSKWSRKQDSRVLLEELLHRILNQVEKGNRSAFPDYAIMNKLLITFARIGGGKAAERLFWYIVDNIEDRCFYSFRSSKMKPVSAYSVNMVLNSWRNMDGISKEEKYAQCRRFLHEVHERVRIEANDKTHRILDALRIKS